MTPIAASVHCVPSSDSAFAAHAERLLRTVADLEEAEARRVLEARLRLAYPGAVVRPRDPFACVGDPPPLWYAYRNACDGPSSAPLALVADDEPGIGEVLGRLLGAHGWRVIVTPGPASALAESAGLSVDLLVTDFEMPGMSGLGLAARVRELNPAVHVVVVSGHPHVSELVDDPTIRVLTKPFSFNDLLEQVARLTGLPVGGRPASSVTATATA